MEEDSDAFYVVRKGDIIGIYKSLNDCQAQVSSSVCDPSVSVYKGYSLLKETEEFLGCRGLKNALYTMNAVEVNENLFGTLVPCPFQVGIGSSSVPFEQSNKHSKDGQSMSACILEFDGASKGNPGKAGAGAILRVEDGSVISRIHQGLGNVTNNVAEYRALILGMKYALKRGFKQIRVQGDSNLVVQQVNGVWQCRHQNMTNLCKEVKELKDKFLSFKIRHVLREFNSDADVQANLGVGLPDGEVQEVLGEVY